MTITVECKECKRKVDIKGMVNSVCVDCQELLKVWRAVAPKSK